MLDTYPPMHPIASIPPVRRTWLWIAAGVSTVLLAGAGLAYTGIQTYNELQVAETRIGYSRHQVIGQYVRRMQLVPHLVAEVRPHALGESDLFMQIDATRARLDALAVEPGNRNPATLARFEAAQEELSALLGRLLLVAERYPELQSAQRYQDLVLQLEGAERRLVQARQHHLASVAEYHLGMRRFPGVLVAGFTGLDRRGAHPG